jgi:DoxX-like family
MNGISESNLSKRKMWAGTILTAIVTVILIASAIAKIAGAPQMVDGLMHAGIPRGAIVPIAILELSCLALYLFPRSAVVGAVLLTGYFGGAIVTHIIGGENFVPPLIIGLWVWGGVYFRVAELRDLLPLRKSQLQRAHAPFTGERALNAGYGKKEQMRSFQRFAPWINRLVLAAATLIFTTIGLRYISDPVGAAAATGATLNSALAITTTRIGFGAFPLGFAIFSFTCLISARRLVTGVSMVATIVSTAIFVRLFSIRIDGLVAESSRLFVPETVILLLSLCGLMLEAARNRQSGEEAHQ